MVIALARIIQLVGASFHTPKGWGFDSWSGHITRLWVQSPVGVHMGGKQSMPLSLSPPLPLPIPLSLKSINIFFKNF